MRSVHNSKGVACLISILYLSTPVFSQDHGVTAVYDSINILPEKERARVRNEWLKWRLGHIIPELMRSERQ